MKPDQMTFRCSDQFKADLDVLRKAEPDLPSRTVMLHRLVERAAHPSLLSGRLRQKQERREAKAKLRAKLRQGT